MTDIKGTVNTQLKKLVDYAYRQNNNEYSGTFVAVVEGNSLRRTLKLTGNEDLYPMSGLNENSSRIDPIKDFLKNILQITYRLMPQIFIERLILPINYDPQLQLGDANKYSYQLMEDSYLEWYNESKKSSEVHDGALIYVYNNNNNMLLQVLKSAFIGFSMPGTSSRRVENNIHGGRYVSAENFSKRPNVIYTGIVESNVNGNRKYIAYGFEKGKIVFSYSPSE